MDKKPAADKPTPIKPTPLSLATGVNGIMKCGCGHTGFKVGVAVDEANGNNFIRILECTQCLAHTLVVHGSDAGLAPMLGSVGMKQQ